MYNDIESISWTKYRLAYIDLTMNIMCIRQFPHLAYSVHMYTRKKYSSAPGFTELVELSSSSSLFAQYSAYSIEFVSRLKNPFNLCALSNRSLFSVSSYHGWNTGCYSICLNTHRYPLNLFLFSRQKKKTKKNCSVYAFFSVFVSVSVYIWLLLPVLLLLVSFRIVRLVFRFYWDSIDSSFDRLLIPLNFEGTWSYGVWNMQGDGIR